MINDVEYKIKKIISSTERMRRDGERISAFLDTMVETHYSDDVEGHTNRVQHIDQALAELSAISSFLSSLVTMLFSGEFPKELFEVASIRKSISKSEFSSQIFNLLAYYKSLCFMLLERSKIARLGLEYCISRQEKTTE